MKAGALVAVLVSLALWASPAVGQAPAQTPPAPAAQPPAPQTCTPPTGPGARLPGWRSVEQLPDRRVTFRLCAPHAAFVRVTSSDVADVIPMNGGLALQRDATGLWSATTAAPVAPDTYRFNYQVDGVRVPDPRGTTWSEERFGTNGTFEVTGSAGEFQTYRQDVPHGIVSEVEYWSSALGTKRRAHVYTPPGYMNGSTRYPVLYLVHGGGDSDDSWTSVGRAHYILDNLIAAGSAKPMIVVMPAGHTPERPGVNLLANEDFGNDFIKDLIPYVDRTFRTRARADSRAMAGLSMGGAHTLRFGLPHPELFRYIGVFSASVGIGANPDEVGEYERANEAGLRRAARELELLYYAYGRDDAMVVANMPRTRAVFDTYDLDHVTNETEGGHTWINWRRYLADFAPRLFR